MEVTLPADLTQQVNMELASGRFATAQALIEQAVRQYFDQKKRGQERLEALRRMGAAVDAAGLYDRVLLPD
jgi:Arc/MetJ-type ribon-helix-helix transcriptional regulator